MDNVIHKAPIDIMDVIYARRAVRKYRDLPVEQALLEKILDAGRMAPSAMNRQPWKFYLIDNRQTIQVFSNEILAAAKEEMHLLAGSPFLDSHDAVFHGAPVVIFLSAPTDNEWAAFDIGMCAQNMMLAAKALGLDTCPIGLAKFVTHTPVYQRLHIPSSEKVMLAIVIGYGDEIPAIHARNRDNVWFVQ
ncbi:MAG TPA: nitroreductase [Chitinophagaceae bacterium]|nr:nitroreductase [Chitinophagaceae bacterium]